MECPKQINEWIHKYLDGDISEEEGRYLKEHLHSCRKCMKHYQELEKTVLFVKSLSHIAAPDHFTQKVMASLPKEKRSVGVQRWLRNHPFLAAASLFIILMTGVLFSSYEESRFSVTKYDNIIVDNNTVIVPEGETVKGDITVKNGDIEIKGKVEGDVTVINGEQYMASAGQVTGKVEEINESFEWLWYEIKTTLSEVFQK